jgi:hypothetical protein
VQTVEDHGKQVIEVQSPGNRVDELIEQYRARTAQRERDAHEQWLERMKALPIACLEKTRNEGAYTIFCVGGCRRRLPAAETVGAICFDCCPEDQRETWLDLQAVWSREAFARSLARDRYLEERKRQMQERAKQNNVHVLPAAEKKEDTPAYRLAHDWLRKRCRRYSVQFREDKEIVSASISCKSGNLKGAFSFEYTLPIDDAAQRETIIIDACARLQTLANALEGSAAQ